MSLETLAFKYIGQFTLPASTLPGTLETINTAFSSTTYADGSARTAGSGVAWTPEAQLSSGTPIAISLTPVGSTLSHKVIYAGGAAGSPVMITPDTYSNTRLIFGLCKNAGSLSNWSSINPFSAGEFSGYTTAFIANTSIVSIHVYESKDTILLVGQNSAGALYYSYSGAIIDPETSNASAAESDGKVYGLFTSGYNGAAGTPNYFGNFGAYSFLNHGASAGQSHGYIMNFGAASVTAVKRSNALLTIPTAADVLKNTESEYVRLPIYVEVGGRRFYGRLREVFMFGYGTSFTKLTVSNVVTAYILGASQTSTSECIALKA